MTIRSDMLMIPDSVLEKTTPIRQVLQQALDALQPGARDVVVEQAIHAIEAALAQQDHIADANKKYTLVPVKMLLEDADLKFLHGLSQPGDDGEFSTIALHVGNGHAGYGLYASLDEYPEEGADIICKFDRSEAQQDQPAQDLYPLPDSLYPGSKDWQAGSYKERVEWLHGMYESAKQEIARLEAQQAQEPVAYLWQHGETGRTRIVYDDEVFTAGPTWALIGPLFLGAPPTQPALSDERLAEIAKPFISSMGDHWCHEDGIRDNGTIEEFAKAAIEAHCRGGADK